MVWSLTLLFLLLILLFLLSQKIQTYIYKNVFAITNNKNVAIGVLIILLLPGTIIHEFSHLIVATILRVPTGELSILPTIEKSGEIKAGKLMLGKADPFRLSIIGLAPIIIGLALIYLIGKSFSSFHILFSFTPGESIRLPQGWFAAFLLFAIFYFLFAISITMFSSKKDLESLIFAFPITLLIAASLYIIGIRLFLEENLISKITIILSDLNYFLLITAGFDFFVYLVIRGFNLLPQSFRHWEE